MALVFEKFFEGKTMVADQSQTFSDTDGTRCQPELPLRTVGLCSGFAFFDQQSDAISPFNT